MKRLAAGILCLAGAVLLCRAWTQFRWNQFEIPEIIGSEIAGVGKSEDEACREWFSDYTDALQGMNVPYEYRIYDAVLNQVEVLDGNGYVQLDYTMVPAAVNSEIIQNLELVYLGGQGADHALSGIDSRYLYLGQMVVRLEEENGIYKITEKMRPVDYQIQSPEFQEEIRTPQTQHYAMRTDREETYYIDDGVLYVTYDGGGTFAEVPDGYERVCRETNGLYDENLEDGSYLISPEFTAFLGFDSEGTVMIYSTDQGAVWQESRITDLGYKAGTYLSRIGDGCVAVFAMDRSLGTDYYGIWMTDDMKTWRQISTGESMMSNVSAAFWVDAQTGYYASGQEQSVFYRTVDQGQTWQEITLPQADAVIEKMGYNPFDQVEQFYLENGVYYMVVGQGDDGDYTDQGNLIKALFRSEDGEQFTFEKEITDSLQEAG